MEEQELSFCDGQGKWSMQANFYSTGALLPDVHTSRIHLVVKGNEYAGNVLSVALQSG